MKKVTDSVEKDYFWNKPIWMISILSLFLPIQNIQAAAIPLGTIGGLISKIGKITNDDEIRNGGLYGIPIGGVQYADIYTFTAVADGELKITLGAKILTGNDAVSYDVFATGGQTESLTRPTPTTGKMQVRKGCSYTIKVYAFIAKGQDYSITIQLPGTTPSNGGNDTPLSPRYYNITFDANWGEFYEIDYYTGSGVGSTIIPNPCKKSIQSGKTLGSLEIPSCRRQGYSFIGWYTSMFSYTNSSENKVNSSYKPTSDLTLYAHWGKEITIKYHPNGGVGSLGPQTGYAGKKISLLENSGKITKQGYSFAGWATSSNGTVEYVDGAAIEISSTGASSTIELYAVWEPRRVTVYFDENWDGGNGCSEARQYVVSSYYLRNNLPTPSAREGYVFVGWCHSAAGWGQITADTIVPNHDVTLYAKWEMSESEATVVFYMNDGTGAICETKSYTVSYLQNTEYGTFRIPQRNGYVFEGWYTGNGDRCYSTTLVPSGNTSLYAHWHRDGEVSAQTDFSCELTASGESYSLGSWQSLPFFVSGSFSARVLATEIASATISFVPSTSGQHVIGLNSETDGSFDSLQLELYCVNQNTELVTLNTSGKAMVNLNVGMSYELRLSLSGGGGSAKYHSGHSEFNIQVGGSTVQIPYLDSPSNVTAYYNATRRCATLSWNKVVGATKYLIYASVNSEKAGAPLYHLVDVVTTGTQWQDVNFQGGDDRVYWIRAANERVTSKLSAATPAVSVPAYLSASLVKAGNARTSDDGSIDVAANVVWTAVSSADWISIVGETMGRNDTLYYHVDENTSSSIRTGTIAFTYSEGEAVITNTVVVTQRGLGASLTVDFYDRGEIPCMSRAYIEGETYDDLPVLECPGYTFLGWSSAESGGEAITADMVANSDVSRLYAKWRPNTYTIRFNANGGSGAMDTQAVTYNLGWQLPKCLFSKTGCAFWGWANETDGKALYLDAIDGENLSVEDGVIVDLYAVWCDASRYYGPWGYEPETIKDDVAATTLSNISVTINGEAMTEGDVVAVYDSDWQLRSIGKVVSTNGKLGVALTMNVAAETKLMFLLWKDGTSNLDSCVAETWIFAPEPGTVDTVGFSLEGALDTPLPVFDAAAQTVTIAKAGWNLVSFNVLPDDPSPAAVFGDVADKIQSVVSGTKRWTPQSGGRLTELKIGVGYWVNTASDNVTWTISGTPNEGVAIQVNEGWNLVGYPLLESGEPGTVLKSAADAGIVSSVVSGTKRWTPQSGGRLTEMSPGVGYWMKAEMAATITFDK